MLFMERRGMTVMETSRGTWTDHLAFCEWNMMGAHIRFVGRLVSHESSCARLECGADMASRP